MNAPKPWKTLGFAIIVVLLAIALAFIGWQIVLIIRDIIANGVWR